MTFKNSRYSVNTDEDYESGSDDQVLKNCLGIKSIDEMQSLEESELKRTELELFDLFDESHQFTSKDICNIHELWLGDIYSFAGKYRNVNIAKEDFWFAIATQIETLMTKLESDFLSKFTPCHATDLNDLANALGIVHVELILIHPFREGNGRVARLLADLMAAQAGRASLNYRLIDPIENLKGFELYIQAIHAGMNHNYVPIKDIFKMLLMEPIT